MLITSTSVMMKQYRAGLGCLAALGLVWPLLVTGAEFDPSAFERSVQALESYRYGSREPNLNQVERSVALAAGNEALRQEVEQTLLRALKVASTKDAKQVICRLLRTIGTSNSVPELEALLGDPELSHMACYALGRIEGPRPREALLRALKSASGETLAAVINTLALRADEEAVPFVTPHLAAEDPAVVTAAVRALGRLGKEGTVEILQSKRRGAGDELRRELDDALLICAERMLADGQTQAAADVYRGYLTRGESVPLRMAGLAGMVSARPRRAAAILTRAVEGSDPTLRRHAIGLLTHLESSEATETLLRLFASGDAELQELVARALAERGDPSALTTLIEATTSSDERVRLAGYEGLGRLNNVSALVPLAQAASRARGREKQVARASLVSLRGSNVDQQFLRYLDRGEVSTRLEIAWAIGQRNMRMAFPDLFRLAQNEPDASVRNEAILALGRVADATKLAQLVVLAVAPREAEDRSSIERAILMVFDKTDDTEAQAGPVLAALDSAPDAAKPLLLGLLSRPATPAALVAVRAAVQSDSAEVCDAAIRTLGEWPTAEPVEDLREIANKTSSPPQRAMALRSYVRMALLCDDPTAILVNALEMAKSDAETKLVLGGLGQVDTLEALELAEKYASKETLRIEAQQALVQVASQYCWQDPVRAKQALERASKTGENDSIRRQATEALRRMEEYRDTINAWQGCGPFTVRDVHDGQTVFNTAFPPEQDPDSERLRWVTVKTAFEGDRRINLEATFGRLDYCSAYVRTTIVSPRQHDVRIEWSVDDYLKGWINGEPITGGRLTLREGANTLMLKVGDHGGGWNFNCRLLTPDGDPVQGLRYLSRPTL